MDGGDGCIRMTNVLDTTELYTKNNYNGTFRLRIFYPNKKN